jgi:hypothetical protein
MFVSSLLAGVLEQRAAVLYYYDVLPGMKGSCSRRSRIDKGVPFEKVIKQNSEDDQGKDERPGYFGNNVRGENAGATRSSRSSSASSQATWRAGLRQVHGVPDALRQALAVTTSTTRSRC